MAELKWTNDDATHFSEWLDTSLGRKFSAYINTQRPVVSAETSELIIRQAGETKGFEDLYRLITRQMRNVTVPMVGNARVYVDTTKD